MKFNESGDNSNQYMDLIEDSIVSLKDVFIENGLDSIRIEKEYIWVDQVNGRRLVFLDHNEKKDLFARYKSDKDIAVWNFSSKIYDEGLRVAYIIRFNLGTGARIGEAPQPGILGTDSFDVEKLSKNFTLLANELPELKDRLGDISEEVTFTCQYFGRFEIMVILNQEASKEVNLS
jgi:hypothetical protein